MPMVSKSIWSSAELSRAHDLVDGLSRMRASSAGAGPGLRHRLCGVLLKPLSKILHGVDLSETWSSVPPRAASTTRWRRRTWTQYLADTQQSYDLVLAADVFIYVGALEPVFAGVARVMPPGGVFCFSVEACEEGPDLALRPSLRYAHSLAYIQQAMPAIRFSRSPGPRPGAYRFASIWEYPFREYLPGSWKR
jgi:predicted TPR repeat methyltransferase